MAKERKTKLFSVSFTESEFERLTDYVAELHSRTGFKVSKNQFVRKATLAAIGFLNDGSKKKDFEKYFKEVD